MFERTRWTKEEEKTLIKYFKEFGNNATLISKHLPNRTKYAIVGKDNFKYFDKLKYYFFRTFKIYGLNFKE